MKILLRNLLLLSLILTSPMFIKAQAADTSKEPEITTKYNDAKGETTIELRRIRLSSDNAKDSYLSVSVSFKGKELVSRPDDVIFIVSVISEGSYKYPDSMSMKMAGDGKNLPDILMLNLDKRPLEKDFLESIRTRMKYDVFKQLSNFKSVKLQLDKTTFQVNETQLALLGKYADQITP